MKLPDAMSSQARERVLSVAERLFSERGYRSVTLKDIASELGIKQASLYHHVPEGKEQLFVEVMERSMERHRAGLEKAIAGASPNIRSQLRASAKWLLSQPPVDIPRLTHADMPRISEEHAKRLTELSYRAIFLPLVVAIAAAQERKEIRPMRPMLLAGSFVSIVENIHAAKQFSPMSAAAMAEDMIDILLDGATPR